MDEKQKLSFTYARRFGVEIEVNAFDGRDFQQNPLRKGELPEGIHYLGTLISKLLGASAGVEICKWHHTHNNSNWVLKPDSSCGMEICSPVSKGWMGLKQICQVIDAFSQDTNVVADHRCSLHVHIDVSDMTTQREGRIIPNEELASILAHWIKCESVFLDSVPVNRKRNRYCQCIGMCDLFDHAEKVSPQDLIHKLGAQKYFTVNTYHLSQHKRTAIEFRIVESEGCKNAFLVKNWIRLLVHFMEVAKKTKYPGNYTAGDRWSGLVWLDPEDVMTFLGFLGEYQLSKGLEQTRNWFLARIWKNLVTNRQSGVWSETGRKVARIQIDRMIEKLGLTDMEHWLNPPDKKQIFDGEYQA